MIDDAQYIHLIGAGGIGISAVGKFLLAQGKIVSGADSTSSPIIDDLIKRGVVIKIGHDESNIPAECDLVVYTEAAGEDNVEKVEAEKRGIPQLGHFGWLGELSKQYRTICVTGTNGKSTTTAMCGQIFIDAGLDPTVFVGSLVPGFELGNLRIGKSDILIIEGDEYKQKMVQLHPEVTVITNIEEDHLDVYRDLDHIVETFQQLVTQTAKSVFVNVDDVNSRKLIGSRIAQYSVNDVIGYELLVPGEFNRANAAAARSVARAFGVSDEVMRKSLENYRGIWRRFEVVGELNGATIVSDYGHHPTAVKATLVGAKKFYPGKRIVLCFQPHQHNRTRELFAGFVESFDEADVLILVEIYGVTGRTDDATVSSRDLLAAVEQRLGDDRPLSYAKDLVEAEQQLRDLIEPDDVVIVMGAGNVDSVARKLMV
jgi:UDP-N-acetylmuramate--alanine ligase